VDFENAYEYAVLEAEGAGDVAWIQRALNQIISAGLAVDGKLGPQTREAIKNFQRSRGLTADGIVGPTTEAALRAALQGGGSAGKPTTLDGFAFDSAKLSAGHQALINSLAREIVASLGTPAPVKSVYIVGHTDPVGSAAYNDQLARRRAEAVATQLRTSLRQLRPGSDKLVSFVVESRGENEQIAGGPARNRRVVITLRTGGRPKSCMIRPVSTTQVIARLGVPRSRSLMFTRPGAVLAENPPPITRPCCMLAPQQSPRGSSNSNLLKPGGMGKHNGNDEQVGLIYTGKAGFLDLGHIRDMVDITKSIHDQLTQGPTPNKVAAVFTFGGSRVLMGEAVMHKCPVDDILVARAIAYDVGLGHEIFTYDLSTPGGHNSSFSPEDLCSNLLGTLIGARALKAGGNFNDAVTRELDKLLHDLDAQSVTESRRAFDLINGRWVKWSDTSGTVSLLSKDYLRRRNFSHVPWKAGHSSDQATPAFVTAFFPPLRSIYTYTHKEGGTDIKADDFGNRIDAIKADAKQRYGANFDSP
jgi:peptidoglycan hydrolase-like protein with peptidoglycan-binding domain